MKLLDAAPAPELLGMPPDKFPSWRPIQIRAADDYLASTTRHVAQALPCGAGKTAHAVACGVLTGRTVCLVVTRSLQDQYMGDFESMGMVSMMGRANYTCAHGAGPHVTCDDGLHLGCKAHKDGACPYVNALETAKQAPLVVTNYAYWMAVNAYGEGLGDVDLLVCDEAVSAMDAVCNMLAVEITNRELHTARIQPPKDTASVDAWRNWASGAKEAVAALAKDETARLRKTPSDSGLLRTVRLLKTFAAKLDTLSKAEGKWVCDDVVDYAAGVGTRTGFRIEPVWPGPYTEQVLFCGALKVLMMSATLVRKTCTLFGIPDWDLSFHSYPGVFDPRRSPVVYVPTIAADGKAVRVDVRMTEEAVRAWLAQHDQMLRVWHGYKGIIHCVSYARQKDIYAGCIEKRRLLWHNAWNAQSTIAKFKASPNGAVLLSPAVTTGYDFGGDLCRFIIISKVPLVDTRGKLMKARIAEDKDYPDYLTACAIQQAASRAMRSDKDWSCTVILDGHWEWFMPKVRSKGFLAPWFVNQCRRQERLPEPTEVRPR